MGKCIKEWNCLSPRIKASSALNAFRSESGRFSSKWVKWEHWSLVHTQKQEASLIVSLPQTSYCSANPALAAALDPLLAQFLISSVVHRRASQEWPRQYVPNAEGIAQLPSDNFRAFRVLKIVLHIRVCPALWHLSAYLLCRLGWCQCCHVELYHCVFTSTVIYVYQKLWWKCWAKMDSLWARKCSPNLCSVAAVLILLFPFIALK